MAKRKDKEPKFEPFPDYGDKMTLKSWLEAVKEGAFIDYDGHGYLATAKQMSDIKVIPSQFRNKTVKTPEWATHVMWFNR